MIFWYKNSFLASLVSILGCVMVMGGIATFGEDAGAAIIFIIIGIAMAIWGKSISEDKAFKKWWKQVEDNNLEPQISQNIQLAVDIYNKNPQKRTLDKIEQLNPAAAAHIRNSIANKK